MSIFGKVRVVVVPQTSDNATTYAKLYEIFVSDEFRDFLRCKISEIASEMPSHVASEKHNMIAMKAGEINFANYLLSEAPVEIEKKMKTKNVAPEPERMMVFNSRLQEDPVG